MIPSGVVVLTDRRMIARGSGVVPVVRAAVAGGARWVLLRERDLAAGERRTLAERLRAVLEPVGGALIVAGPDPLGGTAVHLAAADPMPAPTTRTALVGRSCHSPAELALLSDEDYVTLSPIFATTSKPGYGPPLGPVGAARMRGPSTPPWLALGGVDSPERAEACAAAGASGVAVMGAVMRAADPEAVVRALADGFDRAVARR